ncbi:MAG TPA: glycosyltransferase family 39 protein [Phycisphaerae bacterium]|nr:glycosyltransferase family 39 protein [Phycisphaerae bacterium]
MSIWYGTQALRRFVDILLLLVVCYLVYFGYIDDHEYIQTEGLRAVVVKEMRERPGFTMPTVHHKPYLNKPPLYAWTTTWLSREIGRFDEGVARVPSALAGTALVLLMYGLGERWIARGAGLAAATFTLICPTIADYAVRAELDLPFSLFCTCNIVLTFAALRSHGVRELLYWLCAYAFALLAAMWKGPHSLIFMWLTLIGWSWMRMDRSEPRSLGSRLRGEWRWLVSPGQVLGLFLCLGVLIAWTRSLSAFAGAGKVGRMAWIEMLARLVPHKFAHLVGIFTFVPILAAITVPASVFALLTISRRVRIASWGINGDEPAGGSGWPRVRAEFGAWWRWVRQGPERQRLMAWIVPTLLFMLWAPAKAPRYCMPIFPPIILAGAADALRLERNTAGEGPAIATRVWRIFFGLLALAGLAGIGGVIWTVATATAQTPSGAWRPWAFLAVGGILPLLVELLHPGGRSGRTRLILALAALLAVQPLVHDVYWPMRVADDSQRATARKIDGIVPPGASLYVLGVHEFHDVAMYARTLLVFAGSPDDALARARAANPGADRAYAILRSDEEEELTAGSKATYTVLLHFDRLGKDNLLVEITPAAG